MLRLAAGVGPWRYYVVAPGYAWRAATVYPSMGGIVVISLSPGGSVELSWTLPDERWFGLELRRIDDEHLLGDEYLLGYLRLNGRRGSRRIESLPCGRISFEVGLYDPTIGDDVLFDRAVVEIREGFTARADIAVNPPAARPRVTVTGNVTAPDWKEGPTSVLFLYLDAGVGPDRSGREATLQDRARGTFLLEDAAVGRWLVHVLPFEWLTEVTVSETSRQFSLVVPVARTVRLRLRNAPAGVTVRWAADGSFRGMRSARRDRSGVWVMRTATDRVRVRIELAGKTVKELLLDARQPEHQVPWIAPGSVTARLLVDGRPFGGERLYVRLSRPGSERAARFKDGVVVFERLAPGPCSLDIEGVAGFEDFRAAVIVRPDEREVLDIRLTRVARE